MAKTAGSEYSEPFQVDYNVTDAAPSCTTFDDTLRAGPDAQHVLDLTTACSDPDRADALTYTVVGEQSTDHGSLDTGDRTLGQGIYNGPLEYTSPAPYIDSFSVLVSDGIAANDQTLTVNVEVTPDSAPVCTVASVDDHQSVLRGRHTLTIPISCRDANDDPFEVSLEGRTEGDPGFAGLSDAQDAITYDSSYEGLGPDRIHVHVFSDHDGSKSSDLVVHVTDTAPACSDVTLSLPSPVGTGC